jgi:hypothetical protein
MIALRFECVLGMMRNTLQACCLTAVMLGTPALAQDAIPAAAPEPASEIEMNGPRLSFAAVDWTAARAALTDQLTAHGEPAPADVLTRLNAASEKSFPNIGASPVPVLLPFDAATYLHDAAQGSTGETGKYLPGVQAVSFFFVGPSGYDAALSFRPPDGSGLDLTFENRVDVQISASTLLYELDAPVLAQENPVPELESDFPGIRRLLLEERVRYTFTRFSAPYVVSMLCNDGSNSARRLSCREADKVAVRILKALAIAGGSPQTAQAKADPQTIERPGGVAADFTYYAPGDIIPGTGVKGQTGRADATVYATIRFPVAQAPAYANSQSFTNWGDCDHTGRVGGGDSKDAPYHCRVNSVPLVHDEAKNYAYPWRDNFCEHRSYFVGQCPAGLGHQGQDIRPGSCLLRNEGADRCEPYQHDVVAVDDGMLMRTPGDRALYLVVDKPGEHIRFRYLHMNPQMLDAAGMVSGRAVTQGEVLGAVANYGRHEGGTSTHLHFDMQVLTRDGWVFASPYMTLVAAYERLIGGRGRVVRDAIVAAAPAEAPGADGQTADPAMAKLAAPNAIMAPERESAREHESTAAEHCKTRHVKGHRRRLCVAGRDEGRERGRHGVRSVDRGVSHQGHRARHHGGDVHTRHARGTPRHHGA